MPRSEPIEIPHELAHRLADFVHLVDDLEQLARDAGAGDVADALHGVSAAARLVLRAPRR